MSTHSSAKQIIATLRACLDEVEKSQLCLVRSVFLAGSFVRGDWLDSSSDLDINLLYKEGATSERFEADVATLKASMLAKGAPVAFPSQCPGSIDWGFQTFVPESLADVSEPTPYAPYGIFYFDFLAHLDILWGDDFSSKLPPVNDTRSLVLPTLKQSYERLKSLPNNLVTRQRTAFATYQAVVMLQLFFGDLNLDKFRMLELYRRNVPDFTLKERGESIIRTRLTAKYPHHPPEFWEPSYYLEFVQAALELIGAQSKEV